MTYNFFSKISFMALLAMLVLASCSKENSVEVIETEEELELGFRMTVNGSSVVTDAVAAYCQSDTSEFLIVSNKAEHLVFPLQSENLEVGDYVYFTSISEATTWAYGTQVLGEDVTGSPGILSTTSDALIDIESNDGDIVIGSTSGSLLGIDLDGNFVVYGDYEAEFVAAIIQESQSPFCE